MGTNSKLLRYREAGEKTNINNEEKFGKPAKSLFTTTKILTLHHHIDITDAEERVVFQADTKFPSLHDKTVITDANGNQVAYIQKKILTLHERHFVTMANGNNFEISNEFFHLIKDITNIEGLGWRLQGNILALNFELYDGAGNIIAVIGQKIISMHDKYCIDIYRPEYEKEIVAILVTLQHMINDRENAQAQSSSN